MPECLMFESFAIARNPELRLRIEIELLNHFGYRGNPLAFPYTQFGSSVFMLTSSVFDSGKRLSLLVCPQIKPVH